MEKKRIKGLMVNLVAHLKQLDRATLVGFTYFTRFTDNSIRTPFPRPILQLGEDLQYKHPEVTPIGV